METTTTVQMLSSEGITRYYRAIARAYSAGGVVAVVRDYGEVLAIVALAALVLFLLLLIVLLPARRKVVRKRVVRVRKQAVTETTAVTSAPGVGAGPDDTPPETTPATHWRVGTWLVPLVSAIVVLGSFVAVYVVTSADSYCAQNCHSDDRHVAYALKAGHARCVQCHEGGPLTGGVSRVRMLAAYVQSHPTGGRAQVSPSRCLGCHRRIEQGGVQSRNGVHVSHAELLSGGFTCDDCHRGVGHRTDRLLEPVMAKCGLCHDGTKARDDCATCHEGGSPLRVAGNRRLTSPAFKYPQVQVASRDCTRCHGNSERCIGCHNGFQLPHPDDFLKGGHARIAAFEGRSRCYKCHSLTWCGSGTCHQGFTPHDEKNWKIEHRKGTSEQCGSCHIGWDGKGDFCKVCH